LTCHLPPAFTPVRQVNDIYLLEIPKIMRQVLVSSAKNTLLNADPRRPSFVGGFGPHRRQCVVVADVSGRANDIVQLSYKALDT
jgi:hypothetical protein